MEEISPAEKIRKRIEAEIASLPENTEAARRKIYDKFRGVVIGNPKFAHMSEALENSINQIEQVHMTDVHTTTSPRNTIGMALALVAGLIVGAGGMYLYSMPSERAVTLEKMYQNGAEPAEIARAFLDKVQMAVQERQKADPASMTANGGRFISLREFDPELASTMPTLPEETTVNLRADAKDYKVVMNWPLCGSIKIIAPEMVDAVRSRSDTLGCATFGVWSPGGKNW